MPSTLPSSGNPANCQGLTDDDFDKKRRQLLIRSAKRPFKRSRLLQQQRRREEKEETDTVSTASLSSSSEKTKSLECKKSKGKPLRRHKIEKPRKRRMVSFDTKYNILISVPSHKDLSATERRSYFLQRDEYVSIKRNIQRTIEFLRSPNEISVSSVSASSSRSTSRANSAEDEHCVRGLECLAEDFVNDHKRRVQKNSKTAVFQFQEKRRRRLEITRSKWTDEIQTSQSKDEAHEASLALAEVYRNCTVQCENIARRWGHFDAIDAGADPASSSATAVTCATVNSQECEESAVDSNIIVENPMDYNASLSSLSYDGEEEEIESNEDFNLPPVVDARETVHGFDSLPEGLFNF